MTSLETMLLGFAREPPRMDYFARHTNHEWYHSVVHFCGLWNPRVTKKNEDPM